MASDVHGFRDSLQRQADRIGAMDRESQGLVEALRGGQGHARLPDATSRALAHTSTALHQRLSNLQYFFYRGTKKMRTNISLAAGLLSALLTGNTVAAEHVVSQKGRAFLPKKLVVLAGDRVKFTNDDPFAHNVFSLSEIKSFDLGSCPQGQGKTVVLDTPGTVEIECAVHPDMKMVIEVTDEQMKDVAAYLRAINFRQ